MNKQGMSDKTFEVINTFLVSMITLIILYPLIFVLSASISDPTAVNKGEMWLFPVNITFDGFKKILENDAIWLGYRNTILYTFVGTTLHLFVLLPCAYALSRNAIVGKKFFLWFILFTMLFSGGLIPTFLVVKGLNLLDTMWAIVIPGLLGA